MWVIAYLDTIFMNNQSTSMAIIVVFEWLNLIIIVILSSFFFISGSAVCLWLCTAEFPKNMRYVRLSYKGVALSSLNDSTFDQSLAFLLGNSKDFFPSAGVIKLSISKQLKQQCI
jgi:hypothetical protein